MQSVASSPPPEDRDWRFAGFAGTDTLSVESAVNPEIEFVPHHQLVPQRELLLAGEDREDAGVAETVIPPENRRKIVDTRQYPFSAICALRILTKDGRTKGGTGFFASDRVILTAGHNVYLHGHGGFAERIAVLPGLNGDLSAPPFPQATSSSFRTVSGWWQNRNQLVDFGAIILPSPIGRQTGWFSVAPFPARTLQGLAVSCSGYPVRCPDRDTRVCGSEHTTQWFDNGNLWRVEPSRLLYLMDTTKGQSGAPVFAYYPEKADPFQVVGIHNYSFTTYNAATRITPDVFAMIGIWLNEAAGTTT
jgi:glutamyl endopeptidase